LAANPGSFPEKCEIHDPFCVSRDKGAMSLLHQESQEEIDDDANGDTKSRESFDQVLLFAHVKLHNQSNVPLILQDVLANVRLADGVPLSVSPGSVAQFEEAFLAFPKLDASHGKPLAHHTVLEPGQSVDGTVLWVFRLTKHQWDARKD
jgi:hypothetical protein